MRGQAAIEYLMTWGWMIVVIAVVSAALYSLGVFNPSTWVQKSVRGFSSFSVEDWVLSSTSLTVTLASKEDSKINVTEISASSDTVSCSGAQSRVLNPGEKATLTAACTGVPPAGTGVTLEVTVSFRDLESGLYHRDYGYLTGKVE